MSIPITNIIQNEADRRPLLVDNYANTFPALQFDGVDDYFNGGDICDLKLTGGTLIAVLQHEYITSNVILLFQRLMVIIQIKVGI